MIVLTTIWALFTYSCKCQMVDLAAIRVSFGRLFWHWVEVNRKTDVGGTSMYVVVPDDSCPQGQETTY